MEIIPIMINKIVDRYQGVRYYNEGNTLTTGDPCREGVNIHTLINSAHHGNLFHPLVPSQ